MDPAVRWAVAAADCSLGAINTAIRRPDLHPLLSVLKALRNGMVYGGKVRLTNALVMALLFGDGRLLPRMRRIAAATKAHACRLGLFAALFKTTLLLLGWRAKRKRKAYQPFLAGLIAGWCVWGEHTAINEQVNLYLFARVLMGLLRLAQRKSGTPTPPHAFRAFAAVAWCLAMGLFYLDGALLQSGLRSSMQYIYRDSDHWTSLRTLLWHNR